MKFSERIRLAVAAFRLTGGVELPVSGRSSVETTGMGGMLAAYLTGFASVSPVINFDILRTLKNFAIFNPDISQGIGNIVDLGNTGHQLAIDAASPTLAETAVNRLNESASRIFPNAAGVDGLINQYFWSTAIFGAVSSEDVVDLRARRVDRVVMVPVELIRFFYNKETDRYDAYQRSAGSLLSPGVGQKLGMVQLNPETYKYYALSTIENSPYAKPPFTAAVEPILQGQIPIMENIRYMAQKVGLMGFVDYSAAKPPQRAGEDPDQYAKRCTDYISDLAKALDGKLNRGMLVHTNEAKVDHTPVTTGAAGVDQVNQISEQQIMSGVGQPPVFFGRTDSSTETYAEVVYQILLGQVANMRRLPKRRMERTYMLDLMLAGIAVDGVTMTFNKPHSKNALSEAQTDSTIQATMIERVRTGLVSPDDGAQELGYETWFDPTLIAGGMTFTATTRQAAVQDRRTINLSFDKAKQRYVFQPERLEVNSERRTVNSEDAVAAGNVFSIVKKKAVCNSH